MKATTPAAGEHDGPGEVGAREQSVQHEDPEHHIREAVQPSPRGRVQVVSQIGGDRDEQQQVEADRPQTDRQRRVGDPKGNDEVEWADARHGVERHRQHVERNQRYPAHGQEPVEVREVAIAHGAFEHGTAQGLAGEQRRGHDKEGGERRRARRQPEQLVETHAAAGRRSSPLPATRTTA